jgi:MFS family permease
MLGILMMMFGIFAGTLNLMWNYLSMVINCVFLGVSYGCIQAVKYTVMVDLFGKERIALSYGWHNTVNGFIALFALPLAGFIYDITNSFRLPFYLASGTGIMGGGLVVVVACHQYCYVCKHTVDKLP